MGVETAVPTLLGASWGSLRLKPSNSDTRDWPTRMDGDACWDSQTFQGDGEFVLVLNQDEISEVRAAVRHFNSRCYPFGRCADWF